MLQLKTRVQIGSLFGLKVYLNNCLTFSLDKHLDILLDILVKVKA